LGGRVVSLSFVVKNISKKHWVDMFFKDKGQRKIRSSSYDG
jgi:hypothetical protein